MNTEDFTGLDWIILIVFILAINAVVALILKLVWNFTIAAIFGIAAVTFWQAWGIVILLGIVSWAFRGR